VVGCVYFEVADSSRGCIFVFINEKGNGVGFEFVFGGGERGIESYDCVILRLWAYIMSIQACRDGSLTISCLHDCRPAVGGLVF
jgi:hypothetical protein